VNKSVVAVLGLAECALFGRLCLGRDVPRVAVTDSVYTKTQRLDSGLVQGVVDDNIAVYKGIPFASPPLGNLRWKPPQPPQHWKGVLKADQFPSQCSQLGPPLPTMPEEPTSEDCLYLNVWAPRRPEKANRPVMVFFYGGGFRHGSASTPLYASGGLPKSTGVVLVTVNYRVGPLGFLAHPELTAESPHHVSGNYALLDAIAGLQWVRRNIATMGGDPTNVTVFGQSAGSYLVNKLMISPLAKGLYQRAIAESGADMGPIRTDKGMGVLGEAEQGGIAFAKSFGVGSIAELRNLPADKITASEFPGLPKVYGTNQALPIVDGYVIPDDPYTLYARGRQAPVPLLLGYNEGEGEFFENPTTAAEFTASVREEYGPFADQVLRLFPATTNEIATRSKARLGAENAFGWQMWSWARVNAETSHARTYFYSFSSNYGNGHGSELPFVFQYPFGGPWNDDQREIGRKIAAYWSNFAKTGNPNSDGLPAWPEFNPNTASAMFLGQKFESGTMPDLPAHFLMDTFMNAKRGAVTMRDAR
jgi:para-nitrobenzyl esterase